jgi:hypothetical protein
MVAVSSGANSMLGAEWGDVVLLAPTLCPGHFEHCLVHRLHVWPPYASSYTTKNNSPVSVPAPAPLGGCVRTLAGSVDLHGFIQDREALLHAAFSPFLIYIVYIATS